MRAYKPSRCVDTRPPKKSPEAEHRPKYVKDRLRIMREYGPDAFLMPEGTRRRPDVPAYPVISAKTGCLHCGMMRMAYTRIGAAISKSIGTDRQRLVEARERLIDLALQFSDRRDKTNRCNWAIRASKRYL